MESIKFTVIIPLYNKENEIKNTILSVLNQTYQNYEILIINDGSTDNSLKIVNKITDKRIKVITTSNCGVSSARNLGIEQSSYDYLAFLDADDIWSPVYLETMKELILKYSHCSIFCSRYNIKLERSVIESAKNSDINNSILQSYWETLQYKYEFVWTSAMIVNKISAIKSGLFDSSQVVGEDLDFITRIVVSGGTIAYTNDILVTYNRMTENNARLRIKIANPKSYINELEKVLKSVPLTELETKSIKNKISRKKIMYIFTLILNNQKKFARNEIKNCKYISRKIALLLKISSFLPGNINRQVYKIRMRVY